MDSPEVDLVAEEEEVGSEIKTISPDLYKNKRERMFKKRINLYSKIVVLVCLFSSIGLKSQDREAFNQIYTKAYIETSQTDIEKALAVADSLYQISETPIFKVRSLMLSASLYQMSGDLKKAISMATRAEKLIVKTDEPIWEIRVYGFLATQYRILTLYNQSSLYIEKAIKIAEKISDKAESASTLGFLIQERAFGEEAREEYEKALESFKEAGEYIKLARADSDYLIAQNNVFIGRCYLNLNKEESARMYFMEVVDKVDLPKNYIMGLAYIGLTTINLRENDLENATTNLKEAEKIALLSPYLEFVEMLYDTQINLYSKTSDIENLQLAYSKRDSINSFLRGKKNEYIDESYANLIDESIKINKQKMYRNYSLAAAFLLIVGGLTYFLWYRSQQKKDILALKRIIEKLDKLKQEVVENEEVQLELAESETLMKEEEEKKEEMDMESIMSQEVEEKILNALTKFEKSNLFTKNSISLPTLASYCNTNVKYLSYCIDKHKEKNFNNYINGLRIDYIIQKLYENPLYRKYKLAILAEEAGFSSHNKFSSIFKKHTTMSPSNFIKYLELEMKETEVV